MIEAAGSLNRLLFPAFWSYAKTLGFGFSGDRLFIK